MVELVAEAALGVEVGELVASLLVVKRPLPALVDREEAVEDEVAEVGEARAEVIQENQGPGHLQPNQLAAALPLQCLLSPEEEEGPGLERNKMLFDSF